MENRGEESQNCSEVQHFVVEEVWYNNHVLTITLHYMHLDNLSEGERYLLLECSVALKGVKHVLSFCHRCCGSCTLMYGVQVSSPPVVKC